MSSLLEQEAEKVIAEYGIISADTASIAAGIKKGIELLATKLRKEKDCPMNTQIWIQLRAAELIKAPRKL